MSNKKLYDRLRDARLELHLSQEYVSGLINLNRTALVQIEAGKRKVTSDELTGFSKIYGISVDELLYGKEVAVPEKVFVRDFSDLDEADQKEIINLIEFKKMVKARKNNNG
jgi:transcriptional regulator with XRE-family HTH domain